MYKTLLEECAKERPNDSRTARLLTREYVKYKEWENVIIAGEKYFKIERKCLSVYDATTKRYMGRAYKNLKKYPEARKCFEEAIELAPKYREPYIELALLERDLFNYTEAIQLFEKALTITEKNPSIVPEIFAWNELTNKELAKLYKNKGNFKKAYDNILLAEKINPKNEEVTKIKNDIKEILVTNNELE
jgi:tetratricopeptide (TPR) repeat protein